jgi:hypothetical protein
MSASEHHRALIPRTTRAQRNNEAKRIGGAAALSVNR